MRSLSPAAAVALGALALSAAACTSAEDRCLAKLDSPDPAERRAAVWRLGEMRSARAAPALAGLLTEDELSRGPDSAFDEAKAALAAIGRPAVPALLDAVHDGRQEAAHDVLGRIGPEAKEALPVLIEQFRWRVIQHDHRPHHPSLIQRHSSGPYPVGCWGPITTAAALIRIAPDDPLVREALVDTLGDRRKDIWCFRVAAGAGLGTFGPPAAEMPGVLPALLDAVERDPEAAVREAAAGALARIGSPRALPALIAALRDPEDRVGQGAADALRAFGPAAAPVAPDLVAALAWPDGRDTTPILHAIGPAAIPAMRDGLRCEDLAVRRGCAGVLDLMAATAGGEATLSALVEGLGDRDALVRYFSAAGLGRLGPRARSAIAPLEDAIEREEKEGARDRMAAALEEIRCCP